MADKSYITHIIDRKDSSEHYFKDEEARAGIEELSTELGSFEIKNVTFDETTFKLTITDKNSVDHVYDLPVESLVKDIKYDSTNKKISFELYNGNKTELDVADLVDTVADGSIDSSKLAEAINIKLAEIDTNKDILDNTKTKVDNIETTINAVTSSDKLTIDPTKIVLENLTITTAVGNLAVGTEGKITLDALIRKIICKEIAGKVTNNTAAVLSMNPSTEKYEIGTTKTVTLSYSITPSFTATNSFSAEPTIEIKTKTLKTPDGSEDILGKSSSTKEFTIGSNSITYEVEFTYDIKNADSIIVYSNIPGDPKSDNLNKYLSDVLSKTTGISAKASKTITGFRKMFYGKSTKKGLVSSEIRSLTGVEVANTSVELKANIGDKYIVLAVPSNKNLTIEYKNPYEKFVSYSYYTIETGVTVAGADNSTTSGYEADYKVCYIHTQDESAFGSATDFKITVK